MSRTQHSQGSSDFSVRVELGPRSYAIHVGRDLLRRAGELISSTLVPRDLFLITHPVVDRLHGEALRQGLAGRSVSVLPVPAGERQKTLRRAALLYDQLLALGADRSSAIIAFGGGVIGDLAGFVAATYMRGIAYVQVPTTLLAQVDASVGGKVAVDHPQAKNLIGAFYHPRLVIADSNTMRTLSPRDYRAGVAEVVKHGVITDAHLFDWLEGNRKAVLGREPEAVAHMVRRSCEIKATVVARDERESGLRATLNFGHTIGHALESLTSYRVLRHGEAVAIGMVAAARLAYALGLFSASQAERVERLLSSLRLPTRIPRLAVDTVLSAIRLDKKAVGGVPRFVLPVAIGRVDLVSEVSPTTLRETLLALGATAEL